MEKIRVRKIYCFIALGAFLWLLPSVGLGQCDVSIGATSYPNISTALYFAVPGNVINVSGICTEIVTILANKAHITLNGGGTATLTCPSTGCATGNVTILGQWITINGFNITGGQWGIALSSGANATIDGNTISDHGSGILVAYDSSAVIVNNTIHDNGVNPNLYKGGTVFCGIVVNDNSSALIGFRSPLDTVASPNIIRNNPDGIILRGSANARIVGNTISNNTNNGIKLIRGSQAEISDNLIDGNGQNGIFVSQGSGVSLGNDPTGNTIFDLPNSGTNGDKGLSCSIGGYVDGLLGTLDGLHGALGISKGCFNSVISHHDHGFSR